jgi:hypothetical protein
VRQHVRTNLEIGERRRMRRRGHMKRVWFLLTA